MTILRLLLKNKHIHNVYLLSNWFWDRFIILCWKHQLIFAFFLIFYREKLFKQSLAKLREEVIKANTLVREANDLAQEMHKKTEFHVTLQIPAANLSPNRRVSIKHFISTWICVLWSHALIFLVTTKRSWNCDT